MNKLKLGTRVKQATRLRGTEQVMKRSETLLSQHQLSCTGKDKKKCFEHLTRMRLNQSTATLQRPAIPEWRQPETKEV